MRVGKINYDNNYNVSYKKAAQAYKTALLKNRNNSTEQTDAEIVDYLKRSEQREKQANMFLAGSLLITIPFLFYAYKKTGLLGTSKSAKRFADGFKSLANEANIPTLENCKSINDKLQTFLKKQVTLSKAKPEDLKNMGLTNISKKILLYGPAGTGKTYFAKIFAKTLNAEYLEVSYADLNSRFTGEHIEKIKNVFKSIIDTASKNKDKKYVVTFNEIDAIIVPHQGLIEHGGGFVTFKKEERNLFLNYLDEISHKTPNLTIIGTTNNNATKTMLDEAALSRFGSKIRIDYPDKKCLFEALKAYFAKENGGQFINDNIKSIEQIADTLHKRKASFRDLDIIVEEAKNTQIENMVEHNDSRFKFEYLNNAAKAHEVTDGEAAMGNVAA